jgi:hypothetical protein
MSDPTTQPAIRMELGGIEDFTTAISMLRATGARRLREGRNNRVFVIDQDLTPDQAAALVKFLIYGRQQGFLKTTVNAPKPNDVDLAQWWETA